MKLILAFVAALAFQGDVQLGQQVELRGPSEGRRLAATPPERDFRIEVQVTCERPGTLLDTVGINAAPTGSYTLLVGADRKVAFQVWQPGWTSITSSKTLGAGSETIVVSRRGDTVTLNVAGTSDVGTIGVPLSRAPVWIGDFHGDESWGEKYAIHRGMVGSIRVVGMLPLAASTDLVVDETGGLSADLKARVTRALQAIATQTNGRLYVLFSAAKTLEAIGAAASRLREAQAAAHPNVPIGVLAFGEAGRHYSRSSDFDAKLPFAQVKSAWDSVSGASLGERAAQQIEALAGTPVSQPAVLIGEASIGPEGGKVASSRGDFELTIPAGALGETRKVRVEEVSSGACGRVMQIDAGSQLLSKPATLVFRIPEGVDASRVLSLGHLKGDLWAINASTFDPARRKLTAQTNHFSGQGWFEIDKKGTWQAFGAALTSIGSAAVIHIGTKVALGAAIPVSTPLMIAIAILGHVGWKVGGEAFDDYTKLGYEGPIPIEGFDVYWKPNEVAGTEFVAALIDKKTGTFLTWVTEADTWKPSGQGQTFDVQFPARPGISLADIGVVKVPRGVMNLATDLSTTRQWYGLHGFKPPTNIPVLITNKLGKNSVGERNAGEYSQKTFLYVNGDMLDSSSVMELRATLAHEYFHAIYDKGGFREQFSGSEEAVAVAVESIVWPGANKGMGGANGWDPASRVLANGLRKPGVGENTDSPERRGYVLWSFPKFVYHAHGAPDFRSLAEGSMAEPLLDQMFRAYVRALCNRDDGLDKEVESDDGRGVVATGWPVPLTELAIGIKRNLVPLGKIDMPELPPMALRVVTVKLPDSTVKGPIVVRRASLSDAEEMFVLKPRKGTQGVDSAGQSRDEVEIGQGFVSVPSAVDVGDSQLPILVSSLKGGGGSSPLLVYRLLPPQSFESVGASDGVHLRWMAPALGVPVAEALWGYYIYGRLSGGEVRLVQEFRFPSNTGGSRNALELSPDAVEATLPSVAALQFEALGIASVDRVARREAQLVVSEIQWAGSPTDDLLKELQKTQQVLMTIAGVTEVRSGPPTEQSGYAGQLTVSTWGGFGQGLVDLAKSYGKVLVAPSLSWTGADFNLNLTTGPLEKTSTNREGTTVSKATATLTVRGRYDAKRRSIVDMTFTYETNANSVFSVDPNWKPRSAVDALRPPKASTSQARDYYHLAVDAVPYLSKAPDASGNLIYTFKLDGAKLIPGCYADVERSSVSTDVFPYKSIRHMTVGPPTLGVQVYQPGAVISFVIPKQ